MKKIILVFALFGLLAFSLTGCQSTYVTSAKIYLQQNDFDNAQEQLNMGLQENPNDAQAHFLLGKIYSHQKEYMKMLSEFDAAQKLNPKYDAEIVSIKDKHALDLYNSAVEKYNSQDQDGAIADLKLVTVFTPNDIEAWSLLGKSYLRKEQTEDAFSSLEKAIELDPQFERLDERVFFMEIYYNQKEYEEALNLAMKILRKDEGNKDAIKVAAFCYNQLGQNERALEYYKEVIKDQPDDPDLIFNFGLLYEGMEMYDEAIVQYKKAYELNPGDFEAILQCAQLYIEIKEDYLNAIDCYKKAIEIEPENANIWNNLGIAQLRAGEQTEDAKLIEEGAASIKKATELRASENP